MKEKYSRPEIEVIGFESEDIITTSGDCMEDSHCYVDCISNCRPLENQKESS